jgi:hypothetical protein
VQCLRELRSINYAHFYWNCSDNRWLAILLRILESLVQVSGQRTPVVAEVSRGFTPFSLTNSRTVLLAAISFPIYYSLIILNSMLYTPS